MRSICERKIIRKGEREQSRGAENPWRETKLQEVEAYTQANTKLNVVANGSTNEVKRSVRKQCQFFDRSSHSTASAAIAVVLDL